MKPTIKIEFDLLKILWWDKAFITPELQRFYNFAQIYEFFLFETESSDAAITLCYGLMNNEIRFERNAKINECDYSECECEVKMYSVKYKTGRNSGMHKEYFHPNGFRVWNSHDSFGRLSGSSLELCSSHFEITKAKIISVIEKYGLKIKIKL